MTSLESERPGHRETEAPACAGHEGNPIFKSEIHVFIRLAGFHSPAAATSPVTFVLSIHPMPVNREIVSTPEAPAAIGPYSQALRVGHTLYCSGQIPLDPATGQLVDGGIEAQTTRVLENLKAVLGAAGLTFDHVVQCTVYLSDMDDFAAMNGVYARYMSAFPPARATVAVAGLPRGALIEISCTAITP